MVYDAIDIWNDFKCLKVTNLVKFWQNLKNFVRWEIRVWRGRKLGLNQFVKTLNKLLEFESFKYMNWDRGLNFNNLKNWGIGFVQKHIGRQKPHINYNKGTKLKAQLSIFLLLSIEVGPLRNPIPKSL